MHHRKILFILFIACSPGFLLPSHALSADDAAAGAEPGEEVTPVEEQDIPNIVVVGIHRKTQGLELDTAERHAAPASDGAELLRGVNGISLGRFGGRGLEPTIRGQNQGRINVLIDGSYIHGGCPNRMDPPTAFASVNSYERITVLKGVQSLRYGGGGSGGTLLFERDFEPDENGLSGQFRLGASDNDLKHDVAAAIGLSSQSAWLHLDAEDREAGNYEDGDGNEVRSAWDEQSYNMAAGLRLRDQDRLEFGYERSKTTDALFPGSTMDAPLDEATHARVRYKGYDSGLFETLTFEAYRADVDHVMDNYSDRPLTAPMAMRADSTSDTGGARLIAGFSFDTRTDWTVGIDYQSNDRDALRRMGPDPDHVDTINSYLWPGTSLEQTGIFAEAARDVGTGGLFRFGLRYDHVSADAKKADLDPPPPPLFSPNRLYGMYYGVRHDKAVSEDNWSGLLRFEQALAENWTGFAGVSRTLRTADATERFLASNNPVPKMRWVGNPAIEPEKHRQLDLGVVWRDRGHRVDAVVYYDSAKNYILRDRAHGQPGILRSDGASIYRNVDARIYGMELEWNGKLTDSLSAYAGASWVRSRNTTDDRDVAQTPPLEGRLALDYKRNSWSVGSALRWADRQTRVDTDPTTGSGLDAAESPGWAVLDLYAQADFGAFGMLRAGIDNLFDRTYAEHLNRGNLDPFNPEPVRVNEPGRVLWARYEVIF